MCKMLNMVLVPVMSLCLLLTGAYQSVAGAAERQVTVFYGHNIHGQVGETG